MPEFMPQVLRLFKHSLIALTITIFANTSTGLLAETNSSNEALYAIESSLAQHSLLLDITRAGQRLVTIGERGHILYSDNEGQNWQQARVPTRQLLTAVHFADNQHGWAVGHDATILHTQDAGANWVKQYEDRALEAPLLDIWFVDAKLGFAVGAYGTLLRTNNGGKNWERISHHLDNEDGFHLNAITYIKNSGLFIVGEMGAMFRSADQGNTWETVDSPYEGSLFGVLPTHISQTLVVYGLRGHIFYSSNFGSSWNEVRVETASGILEFGLADGALMDNGDLIIVGHGGSVLRSRDGGQSFSAHFRPDRLSLTGVAELNNKQLLLVGQDGIHPAQPSGAALK